VLDLYTQQAVKIFRGRPSKGGSRALPGLSDFITYANLIWERAKKNDPWADWYLIKIEKRIEKSEQDLAEQLNHVATLINTPRNGLRLVGIGTSAGPVPHQILFVVPQGFLTAELVGLYDELMMAIVVARQSSQISQRLAEQWIHQASRSVRAVYNSPHGYRDCHVSRPMVSSRHPKVREAVDCMGSVPKDVLDGRRLPEHHPGPSYAYRVRRTKKAHEAFLRSQRKSSDGQL